MSCFYDPFGRVISFGPEGFNPTPSQCVSVTASHPVGPPIWLQDADEPQHMHLVRKAASNARRKSARRNR